VAKIDGGFAGNSLFKLSRALPDSLVTRENSLFNERWLSPAAPQRQRDVFHEEMARINTVIKRGLLRFRGPVRLDHPRQGGEVRPRPGAHRRGDGDRMRFRTRAHSQVGAQGLMQIMPRTGRWMGAQNLYDPEQNVEAGAKYLKYLSERFDGNLRKTIAAYNAGEGNVKRYGGCRRSGRRGSM